MKLSGYMNVTAAVRELEKIELIRQPDYIYRLDHAVTSTQKTILAAFDMDAVSVRTQSIAINDDLINTKKKEA